MLPFSYLSRVWMGSKMSPKLLPTTIRPLSAHVKLTENCQAKCISCDYWKSRWQDGIDTERAVELLNEITDAGIGTLRLTGGEPLLRKDLFRILQKANSHRFKRIIMQTNGLLIKKLHEQINDSPISHLAVSMDGVKETNDVIRGIRGYFDLGMEGIKLLRGKHVTISVTLNGMSAGELETIAQMARDVGADVGYNILSQSLFFIKNADLDSMWPERVEVPKITGFLSDTLKRPAYEVDYVRKYYNQGELEEPACVLGYLQVFVLSNGDVLTGCYPLEPVGNILRDKLADILASEAYARQCEAMLRRECPGCTCGVESSLAMKYAGSSAYFHLSRLANSRKNGSKIAPVGAATSELVQIRSSRAPASDEPIADESSTKAGLVAR
jgi:MoaA/NifB/PqqE/SkfB family radical SAM enzyme